MPHIYYGVAEDNAGNVWPFLTDTADCIPACAVWIKDTSCPAQLDLDVLIGELWGGLHKPRGDNYREILKALAEAGVTQC